MASINESRFTANKFSPENKEKPDGRNIPSHDQLTSYNLSMQNRYLSPTTDHSANMRKAITFVPPLPGEYRIVVPVWRFNSNNSCTTKQVSIVDNILKFIINLGTVTHPAMNSVEIRRSYYDDLINGKIYSFHQDRFYNMLPGRKEIFKRRIKDLYPDFVTWLIYLNGKKVKPLTTDVVSGHAEITVEALTAIAIGSCVYISNPGVTSIGLLGLTYLMSKYMDMKKEKYKAPVEMIGRGLHMIKKFFMGLLKTIKQGFSTLLLGAEYDSVIGVPEFLVFNGTVLLSMALYSYYSSHASVRPAVSQLISMTLGESEVDDIVTGHGLGENISPFMITAALATLTLPSCALNTLRNYKNVAGIYKDIVGTASVTKLLKLGVNFLCRVTGTEEWYQVIDRVDRKSVV